MLLALLASLSLVSAPQPRPRVCLALSGGGARGIAEIGVLQVLEERGVPVDCIAGTSMGAVMGSLFASGHSAARIEAIVRGIDWESVASGRPKRRLVPISHREEVPPVLRVGFDLSGFRLPEGAFSDYRMGRVLIRNLAGPDLEAGRSFDRLCVPFRAVATDLSSGERVVLASGSLSRAVRASMSVPVALPPVAWKGRLLVDGGVTDNIPVDVARELGGELVIAVDVTSPPPNPSRPLDALGVAHRLSDVLIRARNRQYRRPADVTIEPAIGDHDFGDYSRFDWLIARGREAAERALPEIAARVRLGSAGSGAPSCGEGIGERTITGVEVTGNQAVKPRVIRAAFGLAPGHPFSLDAAIRGMDAVYALGFFESCWLDFRAEGDSGIRVILEVRETERRVVELGLSYDEADEGRVFLRLHNRNVFGWGERGELMAWAGGGGAGARWRFVRDRFPGFPVGVDFRAQVSQDRPRFFRDGDAVGRPHFTHKEVEVAAVRPIGTTALLEAGLRVGSVETGDGLAPEIATGNDRVRRLTGHALLDRLDEPDLPTRGFRVALTGFRSLPGLGDSHDSWAARLDATAAAGLGRRQFLRLKLLVGASGGDLTPYEEFRVGGPEWIPGLARDELWGREAFGAALSHSVRLVGRLRLTSRAGVGNVWDRWSEASLTSLKPGFGLALENPTRLGPLILGWGVSTAGRTHWSLSVGYR